jgi:hypothetical protein
MSNENDLNEVDSFAFRSCFAVIVQFVAAGLFFAVLLLVFSFFQTGIRAEYTRLMGLNVVIVWTSRTRLSGSGQPVTLTERCSVGLTEMQASPFRDRALGASARSRLYGLSPPMRVTIPGAGWKSETRNQKPEVRKESGFPD